MRAAPLALLLVPAAATAQITPGQWEIVTTVGSMDMPGVPAGVVAMMKGKPIRVKHCITPEEAKQGPQEAMKTDKSCHFTSYSMTGGRLSSSMVCNRGGQTMTSTSSGTYTATSFNVAGKTVGTGSQPMTMTATSVGTRVGACK